MSTQDAYTPFGKSFRIDYQLLNKIREAKQFLSPSHERKVRTQQLTQHSAKCKNHTQ